MAIDESTRIKTQKSARTKTAIRLGKLAALRRILSGAPVTKGVEDLFTQLKFLDEDILGFSSFWSFRAHFCSTMPIPGAPRGAVKITGYKNLDELTHQMDSHSYRATKADCLDLPEQVFVTREVEMTKEQKKAYYELRDDLLTQMDNGEIVEAPLAITKLMKMQQVLCGFIQPEDGPWIEIPNNRVTALLDFLAEGGHKTVVWSRYHADMIRIASGLKKYGLSAVEYHGRIGSDQRQINKRLFIEDSNVDVFLGNPQAAGTGTDGLQHACSTMAYFSNDFNADTRWQSEARIHRSGQKESCLYVDFVIPKTIDVKILKALREKKNVADSVMDIRNALEG
jgi:SNF2 family DNA or RNA helicase